MFFLISITGNFRAVGTYSQNHGQKTSASSLLKRSKSNETLTCLLNTVKYWIMHQYIKHWSAVSIVITCKMQWMYVFFLLFCSLKKMKSPILFLHSEDDHLVPIQVAKQVKHTEIYTVTWAGIFFTARSDWRWDTLLREDWTLFFCPYRCMRSQRVPRMQSESSWCHSTVRLGTSTTACTKTPNCLAS